MAGSTLDITYDDKGVRTMQWLIARLLNHGSRLKPVFADMGEYLLSSIDARFDAQQSPDGDPWKPLRPTTLRRKRIEKILTETSNLRDRIVYRASSSRVEVGTNVIYAAIHQFGGDVHFPTRGRSMSIPARPFLGLTDEDASELESVLHDHLRRALSG